MGWRGESDQQKIVRKLTDKCGQPSETGRNESILREDLYNRPHQAFP